MSAIVCSCPNRALYGHSPTCPMSILHNVGEASSCPGCAASRATLGDVLRELRDAQDELVITKKTIDELERLIGTYRAATRKSP